MSTQEYVLSFTAEEIDEKLGKIDGLADKSELPTKISELTNDAGFITNQTETDPTVPAWAKEPAKPTYTASEVGADASGTANSLISTHNSDITSHADIRAELATMTSEFGLINDKITALSNNKLNASELPEAVNTALAQAKESGEFDGEKGDPGYTPQKEKDYWTDADRKAIIDEVTSQLSLKILNQMTLGYHTDGLLYLFVNGAPVGTGVEFIGGATGDVTGVIDSANNIILTGVGGDLDDGTYTIQYEKGDGTMVAGGNLVISSGPKYTNLLRTSIDNTGAVYNIDGFKNGYRLTGGAYPCESAGTEYFCTGYIPYTKAQANARVPMYVKGITIDLSNVPKYLRVLMVDAYNTTDSYIDTLAITGDSGASNQITIQQLGDKYYKLTPNSGFISGNFDDWKNKDLQFIRWSFPGTGNGVIFTVDEPIE